MASFAAFINKLINKLFGKTWIFIFILAWFLIITGIWMLVKPEKAKKALASQGFGIVKAYLFMLALFIFTLLVSLSNKLSGMTALLVLIAGIVLLIKAYRKLKKKAAQKINAFAEKVTVKYLKVYAVVQTAVGIGMLVVHRRIWF